MKIMMEHTNEKHVVVRIIAMALCVSSFVVSEPAVQTGGTNALALPYEFAFALLGAAVSVYGVCFPEKLMMPLRHKVAIMLGRHRTLFLTRCLYASFLSGFLMIGIAFAGNSGVARLPIIHFPKWVAVLCLLPVQMGFLITSIHMARWARSAAAASSDGLTKADLQSTAHCAIIGLALVLYSTICMLLHALQSG